SAPAPQTGGVSVLSVEQSAAADICGRHLADLRAQTGIGAHPSFAVREDRRGVRRVGAWGQRLPVRPGVARPVYGIVDWRTLRRGADFGAAGAAHYRYSRIRCRRPKKHSRAMTIAIMEAFSSKLESASKPCSTALLNSTWLILIVASRAASKLAKV